MSTAVASTTTTATKTTATKPVNNATSSKTNNSNNNNSNTIKTTTKVASSSGDTTSKTNKTGATNKSNTTSNSNSNSGNNDNSNNNSKQQRLKYIANVVRALVTSRKPPCKLREVLSEYPEIEGEPLNFRKLGYTSAKDLLKATGDFSFMQYGEEVSGKIHTYIPE